MSYLWEKMDSRFSQTRKQKLARLKKIKKIYLHTPQAITKFTIFNFQPIFTKNAQVLR